MEKRVHIRRRYVNASLGMAHIISRFQVSFVDVQNVLHSYVFTIYVIGPDKIHWGWNTILEKKMAVS